jgi:Rrf2 family protein
MIQLANLHPAGDPVPIRAIADAYDISPRFLVQILLQLKGAGLVLSTRGATGGYQLARPPEQVTLGEIVALMEGQEPDGGMEANSPAARVLRSTWREITQLERETLERITLADLLESVQGEAERMYYI